MDLNIEGGVEGEFIFDISYVSPLIIRTSDRVVAYIFPVQAIELINMAGIDDGSLFSQNVRQSLGSTKVNKAMRESVLDKTEHKNFPLYHNGVTILCKHANISEENLIIKDYVVVNGAQSISTFKKSSKALSSDLRVIAKIIKLSDNALARKITINSNNQNAIKARDLKSTNEVQIRLMEEFKNLFKEQFELEIKRGQECYPKAIVITNEEAGRLLLAFDLLEPESCHQVYKLFEDKYAEIFAKPSVNARRIVFLYKLMEVIIESSSSISYKPLAKYGLTRFFLLSVIATIMKNDDTAVHLYRDPSSLFKGEAMANFLNAVKKVLATIIIELNYEIKEQGDAFDYKGDLKSPSKVKDLRTKLLKSYDKDVATGRIESLGQMIN